MRAGLRKSLPDSSRIAVRTGFSALPSGELAFAEQMTERARRWQIRVRANLMRILSDCKTPSVLPRSGNPAPSKREPALSVAARHLSQRERRVWFARKQSYALKRKHKPRSFRFRNQKLRGFAYSHQSPPRRRGKEKENKIFGGIDIKPEPKRRPCLRTLRKR